MLAFRKNCIIVFLEFQLLNKLVFAALPYTDKPLLMRIFAWSLWNEGDYFFGYKNLNERLTVTKFLRKSFNIFFYARQLLWKFLDNQKKSLLETTDECLCQMFSISAENNFHLLLLVLIPPWLVFFHRFHFVV